ncbi:MAG: hypothetical protein KJO38_12590 [Gammaproteobacteria bacterium]|nr:hypothetical protein [Gammaproteobacteria bacterium]
MFYSSFYLTDDSLSVEARGTAARIMMALDQAPRMSMTMILPFGIHLGYALGVIAVPGVVVGLVWLICLGWLAMVIVLHFGKPPAFLAVFDFWFRIAVIVVLSGAAIAGLTTGSVVTATWAAAKLAIFAAMVACGLIIRVNLKPFGPAFGTLITTGPTPEVDAAIASSLARCRPFVVAIWVGLLVNAMLGLHLIG